MRFNEFSTNRFFFVKLFQANSSEIVRTCQKTFCFVLLKAKNGGKTRDEISCVKFMFITCDKKVNTVDIFIMVVAL